MSKVEKQTREHMNLGNWGHQIDIACVCVGFERVGI